ncbi:Uncharacterised protein [Acinetobacter baumannii]|nr:Uncharacterised protein [Acinetobacter baumannii]
MSTPVVGSGSSKMVVRPLTIWNIDSPPAAIEPARITAARPPVAAVAATTAAPIRAPATAPATIAATPKPWAISSPSRAAACASMRRYSGQLGVGRGTRVCIACFQAGSWCGRSAGVVVRVVISTAGRRSMNTWRSIRSRPSRCHW